MMLLPVGISNHCTRIWNMEWKDVTVQTVVITLYVKMYLTHVYHSRICTSMYLLTSHLMSNYIAR